MMASVFITTPPSSKKEGRAPKLNWGLGSPLLSCVISPWASLLATPFLPVKGAAWKEVACQGQK